MPEQPPQDKKSEMPNLLFVRLQEAARWSIEKCVEENRLTKEYFDKVYKQYYEAAWDNFEKIRSI